MCSNYAWERGPALGQWLDRVPVAVQCLRACPPGAAGGSAQAVPRTAEAFRRIPGKVSGMDPAELLRYAVERRASDVHLKAGNVPVHQGGRRAAAHPVPGSPPTDARQFADALMPPHKAEEFARTRRPTSPTRWRASGGSASTCCASRDTVGLAIRWVSPEDLTFEELSLPTAIRSLAETRRGLILVTGPTGSGKTTTIATLLGFINRTRRAHIVTIEDPIEVVHTTRCR